ncbi:MAG TPA: AGE family epimerase/isomerase [Acidobacteriota bacterium]|nr:AGE family epimerase/isomerase [Acidobacteriota bacterium]
MCHKRGTPKPCLFALAALALSTPGLAAQDSAALRAFIPRLEKNLKENIIGFWMSKSLDRSNGGYIINFGLRSEPKGPGTKMIVTQARQVWFFSHLAHEGYGKQYLDAADLGYRFLIEKMWDSKNGGFYWEVDPTGSQKLNPKKHLYGQSFALYAISEFYLASGRKDVLEFAVKFFNLLEARSHDKTYGGYLEYFNEDWSTPPATELSSMGSTAPEKLMNTHLHLLEAMTTFYRASRLPLARERLIELINIESSAVVRKDLAACTDRYDRDWTPRLEGSLSTVSYGHDIENVWLLIDACDAIGISNYPLVDLYRKLWEYTLKYGYDQEEGGVFYTGGFNEPANNRNKEWWVEAEALVSALQMYRLTKESKYLSVFKQTYDFIEKYQVDWERGEWYATVSPDGKPYGDKAQVWKAGYHNGRSMIESLKLIKELLAK